MATCRKMKPHRGIALSIVLLSVVAVLEAQTDPRLVTAVKLAQDGLADSARVVVNGLLTSTPAVDSVYPEVLYTSGLVAATDYERRIALRRVILEFAQSPWADDALLLLAQVEYANGNPGATIQQVSRLLADYPASPLRAVSAFWGARAASDMHDSGTACRIADAGIGAPNDDVELKNQLLYQKQRCAALASQRVDSPKVVAGQGRPDTTKTAHAAPPTPAGTGGAKELAKGFRVQVAAAPTQAKADQAAAKLRGASYAVVIARENGFFKVRSQAFATRAEAVAALVRIRGKLGGQPFVVADK